MIKIQKRNRYIPRQTKYSRPSHLGIAILNLGFLLLPGLVTPKPALSAQKIYLYYGPLEFTVPISSLELYAKEGKIDSEFAFYTRSLNAKQLEQLRLLLNTPIDLGQVAMSQFLYSSVGESLLKRVGEVVQTQSGLTGFYALRAAMIQAAGDPQGFTLLKVLQKFPTYGIRINSERSLNLIQEFTGLIRQTNVTIAAIEQQANSEIQTQSAINFAQLPDLRNAGEVRYQRQSITLNDASRRRNFPVDLYLPVSANPLAKPGLGAPVIVISHGLGGNRQSFEYLAQHLASYGFAVAVLEHPGSNARQVQLLTQGLATQVIPPRELVDRPLDIKFLLDQLEGAFQGQLNLQQVGVIGQSFGGYTALALAGGEINFAQLLKDCPQLSDSLNLSLLLQCRTLLLPPLNYKLQDERVKAVVAINPVTSSVFGESEISQIKKPVMLVSSSADTVTPALAEQIRPFTWLTTPDKYLVLLAQGTHFSTVGRTNDDVQLPESVIGPNPLIAQQYMKALSTAFMQTYIVGNQQYQHYLNAAYAKAISENQIPVSLIRSFTENQLQEINTSAQPQLNSSSTVLVPSAQN